MLAVDRQTGLNKVGPTKRCDWVFLCARKAEQLPRLMDATTLKRIRLSLLELPNGHDRGAWGWECSAADRSETRADKARAQVAQLDLLVEWHADWRLVWKSLTPSQWWWKDGLQLCGGSRLAPRRLPLAIPVGSRANAVPNQSTQGWVVGPRLFHPQKELFTGECVIDEYVQNCSGGIILRISGAGTRWECVW